MGSSRAGAVLLVEDDAGTRIMLTRHLRNAGYDVTAVESAEQGIFEVDAGERRFEVVISDVHLPGTSGIDLASYLLTRNPGQAILLITGDPDEALARDALSRGPVSYLLKPFELFELDAALGQALARQEPVPERTDGAAGEPEIPGIPDEWVRMVDRRSYAGPGHAERVARLVTELATGMADLADTPEPADLTLAARMHELGRLSGPAADPVATAARGAAMLREAGFPAAVVEAVRHLHERWDGTGGPDGLSGARIPFASQLLAVADSLDHYCAAWLQTGTKLDDAVERAIRLVLAQQHAVFSPVVVGAVTRERPALETILGEAREEAAGVRLASR